MAHVRTSMRPWETVEVDDREATYLRDAGLLAPDQEQDQVGDPLQGPLQDQDKTQAPTPSRSRAKDKE